MPVFVVSAPSGTGKTTLNRRLLKECPRLEMSVSHTTRAPRAGEVDGVHYHFIEPIQFRTMVEGNAFIEWAEVHGNLYGTSFSELKRIEAGGKDPLLEIDIQGWHNAKSLLDNAISIFVLPPSMASLWQRLEKRGSDPLEIRWVRLQNAYDEIQKAHEYDILIINNDLEEAYSKLKAIILSGTLEGQKNPEGLSLCLRLNEEFESADWIKGLRDKMGS
ncbi:MAG: guanylate kinase [Proteobacteria bacterium]|nr:MAG: guanylate kinase [Pseudomonadota bacterium]